MEELNHNECTQELNDVMNYMITELGAEYPTKEYTIEYLIVSILDNKRCHAYSVLDTCLMTVNIDKLKNIYVTWLEDNRKNNMTTVKKDTFDCDDVFKNVLSQAKKEKEKLKSKLVGTEHLILSMLNTENKCEKIQEVFKVIGIDYDFLFSKFVSELKEKKVKNEKKDDKKDKILKSEVNIKPITNTKTAFINQYTTNITQNARDGKIDELVGRENELKQIVRTMARRKKNNVIIVGDGGCGKTHLVQGLAQMIVNDNVPSVLKNKEIVMLNVMSIVSGTSLRGQFEERIKGLFDELRASKDYILFIDDIQTVLKSTSREKDTDISPMIQDILSEGDVKVIATTTFKDYKNTIEINSSIQRKFQKITLEPTSVVETIEILRKNKKYYEEFHNVTYDDDVIKKSVELAQRYITDRKLPDSAIDIIDLTGAYTCFIEREPQEILEARKQLKVTEKERIYRINRGEFEAEEMLSNTIDDLKRKIASFKREYEGNKEKYRINITLDNITTSVSDMTGIPVNKLTTDEKANVAHIDEILKKSIIGQDEAINLVCKSIKRSKVGLGNKNRILSCNLLTGQSGCGKTLLAKQLAKEIFGDEKNLVRIDMSEYSEKASVSKLIGSSQGYVGFENGGQLTEAIKRKPHCVLLLDEIEKANEEVYNLFLQLFDEGRLTDNAGQTVSFKNVIVLMTSNIGARAASEFSKGVGFVENVEANAKSIIEKNLKKKFSPEFLNRIDQIIHFNNLTEENLKEIVKLELNKFIERLKEINFNFEYNDSVSEYILKRAVEKKEFGARPIIRLIQDNIEDEITDLILLNDYPINYTFIATCENEKITIR